MIGLNTPLKTLLRLNSKWPLQQGSSAFGHYSASLDRRSKDIRVLAVVVPELKLGDIERQIFLADLVEASHDAALDERPEALDGLSMNRADDILPVRMVDYAVVVPFLRELAIAGPSICAKQTDPLRNGFVNERGQGGHLDVGDHTSHDVALALDRADDNRFASAARSAASVAAFVLMAVFCKAADEGFIDFDDTAKLVDILSKSDADLVAHEPSGLVGTEAHIPLDLQGAHSLFADKHQMNDTKPILERLVRVFKDCAGEMRKAIAGRPAGSALRALPVMAGREGVNLGIAAARADDSLRPSANDQVSAAMIFVREQLIELHRSQLMDGFRLLFAGHEGFPLFNERIMA